MKQLREWLALADVWLEVVDARLPCTGRAGSWPRPPGKRKTVLVLNKADLAEAVTTRGWLSFWQEQGLTVVATDARTGRGVDGLRRVIQVAGVANMHRRDRAVRVAVLGLPNVGKSSLINRLVGRAAARVGRRPGITRGPQWLRMAEGLEVLDTPGDMRFPAGIDREAQMKLGCVGIRPLTAEEEVEVAGWVAGFLGAGRLAQRYNFRPPVGADILTTIAEARYFLLPGGGPDIQRAARAVLQDFQTGRLGRCSLEKPPSPEGQKHEVGSQRRGS